MSRSDDEAARLTREVTARAIRRLDVLEWVIFAGAAGLAVAGGALIAWLVSDLVGYGFRPTWLVASVILFVVPGAIAFTAIRREERQRRERLENLREERESDHDR